MKRFKFRLESVLMIREKTLNDEQTKLASILNARNKQVEKLNELFGALNAFRSEAEKYFQGNNFNPAIVSNYMMYGRKLENDINIQQTFIKRIEKEIENQQIVVKEAYIKVKSLENLKDRQKEQYFQELQQEEIKEIDDIVNSKRNIA